MRGLGLADDAAHVNPRGGPIVLGYPLGMRAVATMCTGVGQDIAMLIERA